MTPPISIDGTDITGATIDGTDVQEITVDGQTVFTAGPTLPVAYSNLIAWYPFDSATYGGSNADDVTAIIGGSGDDTEYDGTVNGANYQSSAGVTDINAGLNSGAFDFDGSNDDINLLSSGLEDVIANLNSTTIMAWANVDNSNNSQGVFEYDSKRWVLGYKYKTSGGWNLHVNAPGQGNTIIDSNNSTTNSYVHLCGTFAGSQVEFYLNGVSQGTGLFNGFEPDKRDLRIGSATPDGSGPDRYFDGEIDDVRVYDTELSTSQIETIVENTQDPNNPVFP